MNLRQCNNLILILRTCDQSWNVDFLFVCCEHHLKCQNNHQHDCGHPRKEEVHPVFILQNDLHSVGVVHYCCYYPSEVHLCVVGVFSLSGATSEHEVHHRRWGRATRLQTQRGPACTVSEELTDWIGHSHKLRMTVLQTGSVTVTNLGWQCYRLDRSQSLT